MILPLSYFPSVSWLSAAYRAEEIVLEAWQPYRRQTYSSRSHIRVSNRVMVLTVPVDRAEKHAPLCKKRISYQENWRQQHWRSIVTAYQNSPWFEFYADELEALFAQDYEYLADLNLASTKFLLQKLKIQTPVRLSESLQPQGHYKQDFRFEFDPRRRDLPDWFVPKSYTQVFEGFEAELSGLDLLCNMGPESYSILRTGSRDK